MGHGPKTKQLDFGGNLDHNAPEYFEGFFDEIFLKGWHMVQETIN